MYVGENRKPLPDNAIVARWTKSSGRTWSIWWNRIIPVVTTYDKINEVLDELDGAHLTYKETKEGCATLATLKTLGIGYFIRKNKDDANNIEVCGGRENEDGDIELFRYKVSQNYDSEFGALDAWIEFQEKVSEHTGKKLSDIFGGLPQEFHQYRKCVPSPINWAHPWYCNKMGSVAENCVKADICSAYGTEASKKLPDCRLSRGKIVDGRAKPTEELPFAFYLKSGHMAIWGEGDTFSLNQSYYITCDHTVSMFDNEDTTLLLAATDVSLASVFEDLYEGRTKNPNNKFIMNATIGMFHRKKSRLDSENLWPVAAVIKFRCNKRIVDTCEWLQQKGQKPILINTDSIMWEGDFDDSFYEMFSDEKKLGNFTFEYKKCKAVMRSCKIYQIAAEGEETITRWSGSHTKKYTSQLAFGQIWQKNVYEFLRELEEKNTIKWDNKKRRFVNRLGDVYTNTTEDFAKWQNKQD